MLAMGDQKSPRPRFETSPGGPSKRSVSSGANDVSSTLQDTSSNSGTANTAPSLGRPYSTKKHDKTLVTDHLHIFLTVNNNDNHRLAQIKADLLQDDSFFARLKEEYINKRGRVRMIFSIWRYAGCEFRKVSILRSHLGRALTHV